MTAKIFIDGEAGTTGLQIRERLSERTDLTLLTIAPEDRKSLDARKALLNQADVAILCLPDEAAKESVSLIENTTTRVIDASTAHRVAEGWAYGFAEMDAEQGQRIADARFVANPGCWPQGLIAALRPLIAAGLYAPAALGGAMMTGVSGYSGGGKQMIADYEQKGDAAPAVMPYALSFEHKHLPEMARYSLLDHAPLFVPTVGNFYQGMLEIIPLPAGDGLPGARAVHDALSAHYAKIEHGFVAVQPFEAVAKTEALNPELLNGTNSLHLHVFGNDAQGQVVVFAVYDNLGKGASGAAVQNLNLMLGVDPAVSLAA